MTWPAARLLAGLTLVVLGVPTARASDLDEIRRLIDAGEFARAAGVARAAVERIDRSDPGSATALLAALTGWVDAQLDLGACDDACAERASSAVALAEKSEPGSLELAAALSLLAAVHEQRGGVAAARPLAERALEIRRRVAGEDHPETAKSLEDLARLALDEGRFPEARALCERAFQINETKLGPSHRATAATLNQLGAILRRQGQLDRARPLVERGLAIRRDVLAPFHPEIGESLNTLATLLYDKGEYREAARSYEEALAVRERAFGAEHALVAQVLNNIGAVKRRLGDLAAARALFERALALREKALGPEHPEIAPNLNTVAATLYDMGDYSRARSLYERALRIREQALGPDHPDVANTLNNLAALLQATGDFAEALPLYRRALAIREKRLGPIHLDVAQSLQNLARLHLDMGQVVDAGPLLERALAIREQALPATSPGVALGLSSLASLRLAQGRPAEARELEQRALEIRRAALGPDHLDLATNHLTLGSIALDAADPAGALTSFERALAIREKSLGPDHPLLAPPLVGMAAALARGGERARALDAALRAEEISRRHLALTARTLPDRQALRYAATRSSGLDWALTIAAQGAGGAEAERAWDALVRSRAVILDEMAARARSLVGRDAASQSLVEAWQASRERYATLALRGAAGEEVSRYRGLVEEARRESEASERSLAEKSDAFRSDRERGRVGLEEARAALPAETALVAFARFRDLSAGGATTGRSSADAPSEQYLAFVVSGARAPALVRLGDAQTIDGLVRRWRAVVARAAPEAEVNTAGARLRRRMWDPVVEHAAGARLILVVPDGSVSAVSVGALPSEDGRYLVEVGPSLHVLSAERDLVQPPRDTAPHGALALGGADFGVAPAPQAASPARAASCADLDGLGFGPLPATRSEVEDLRAIWKSSGRGELQLLVGADATEAAFRKAVAGKALLHLATHGFFLDGRCAAALSNTRGIGGVSAPPLPLPRAQRLDNPLLLSGLAFAGANQRSGRGDEDGVMTAAEIAALDLSGTEWAVLSACDTGLGEITAGEGVLGLRRAFQIAGARTVIMSLWSVDDASTRDWMRLLYDARLVHGRGTAEAVREASIGLLGARRARGQSASPFFWGAFIAAGDWR
jgi:tetratricopeptide (TPR) repeat protein/CHAT domain-containing protein